MLMRTTLSNRIGIAIAVILFLHSFTSYCQIRPTVVAYQCPICYKSFRDEASCLAHMCAAHGRGCAPVYTPPPGPSPEELKRMREEKDLKEASDDANDKGIEFYKNKDWNNAIRCFSEALDYNPDNDDAQYNLQKAQEYARIEQQQKDDAVRKSIIVTNTVTNSSPTVSPVYEKYLKEADNIYVPSPSWESILEQQAEPLRIWQKKDANKYFMLLDNALVSAYDLVAKTPASYEGKAWQAAFKLLIVGTKSAIAAQDEAEIVVFKKNATYERALQMLKDKKEGPELVNAIKCLKDKKPLPKGTSEDIILFAKSILDPSLGNSGIKLTMNAMLSNEAKAAFIETAKTEAVEAVNGEVQKLVGTTVQNRFKALKEVNDKISEGNRFLEKEKDPLVRSIIESKVEELEKKMSPFEKTPEAIESFLSLYEDFKKTKE